MIMLLKLGGKSGANITSNVLIVLALFLLKQNLLVILLAHAKPRHGSEMPADILSVTYK